MLRALLPWLLALVFALGGLVVGWVADTHQVTALVLQAEPVLLVLTVWAMAVLRWSGRVGLSRGLAAGAIAATAAVRLPLATAPAADEPPAWTNAVQRCAAALKPPAAPVRLLHWTVDASVGPDAIRSVVASAHPDVVVLQGVRDEATVDAALQLVGGESRYHPAEGEGTGVAVIAAGGFHPCGESLEWTDALDTPDGLSLAFVGVPPSTVFPLVVARLPGPLAAGWAERSEAARARLVAALGGVQGASTVVVADASAPRTFRHLDAQLLGAGLSSIGVPPTFPARAGPLPLVTLHPYDRVWVGPIWDHAVATRASAPAGLRAPVLTVLHGPATEEADAPPVEIDKGGGRTLPPGPPSPESQTRNPSQARDPSIRHEELLAPALEEAPEHE